MGVLFCSGRWYQVLGFYGEVVIIAMSAAVHLIFVCDVLRMRHTDVERERAGGGGGGSLERQNRSGTSKIFCGAGQDEGAGMHFAVWFQFCTN